MALDGELHADEETLLLENGSRHEKAPGRSFQTAEEISELLRRLAFSQTALTSIKVCFF